MDKPIPVLYTIPNFMTAGSGRAMLNVIERLDRKKFAPAVCVMRKGGDLDQEVERLGLQLIESPFTIPVLPYHTLPFRAWKIAQAFRPFGFILWHSFHYSDDYTEPVIARLAGSRTWVYTKKNMSWGSRAWRLRSRLAHGIAAQNTTMIDRFFPSQRNKVRHIPPGVDIEQFRPGEVDYGLRKSWGFPEDLTIAAHVANFVPIKNHPHLLYALAQTQQNIGLVLAGEYQDASYTAEIRVLIDQLGLNNRVRLLGKVKDMPTMLRAVDIFAFCSHQEACPVAVLEAMACGLPCVVTDIPAMSDIHEPGQTGLVVAQNDVRAFSLALDELAQDPQRRRLLGERARRRIEEFFSTETEAIDYQHFYLDLLAEEKIVVGSPLAPPEDIVSKVNS
jgi:glycosyltransferase involved in cell wall biosynthesis